MSKKSSKNIDVSDILAIPSGQRTYSQKRKLFNSGYYVNGMSKLDTRRYDEVEGYVRPTLPANQGVSGHTLIKRVS